MRRIRDVEHAQAREDEAAGDDLRVLRARNRAVVRGVALHAVLRARVVLLVGRARRRLVDLEPQVRHHARLARVVDVDDARGTDGVIGRVARDVAGVLVELE